MSVFSLLIIIITTLLVAGAIVTAILSGLFVSEKHFNEKRLNISIKILWAFCGISLIWNPLIWVIYVFLH